MESRSITRDELVALHSRPSQPTEEELVAVRRLIHIAKSDTGQSRRVADFLLAWWNAESCGGFDLTHLWGVDTAIATDMFVVFGLVARIHEYPPALNPAFEEDFGTIFASWRSEPASES